MAEDEAQTVTDEGSAKGLPQRLINILEASNKEERIAVLRLFKYMRGREDDEKKIIEMINGARVLPQMTMMNSAYLVAASRYRYSARDPSRLSDFNELSVDLVDNLARETPKASKTAIKATLLRYLLAFMVNDIRAVGTEPLPETKAITVDPIPEAPLAEARALLLRLAAVVPKAEEKKEAPHRELPPVLIPSLPKTAEQADADTESDDDGDINDVVGDED